MAHTLLSYLCADPATIIPYKSIPDGYSFTQLFQHYPMLRCFYTEAEASFHSTKYIDFAKATWPILPLALVCAYLCMIWFGQRFMKDRPAYNWRIALAYWNLSLSIFSFIGMARTVPHLLHNLDTLPFKDTICRPAPETYREGACGLWVMLFIFSKMPELIDTVFIVFRKSKLLFLHWYHHMTVLLYCWHAYASSSPFGLYFVAMNYSVHAIMYGYYYLAAVKAWPKWMPPSIITILQITQMVIGVAVCCSSFYFHVNDPEGCAVSKENLIAAALMYGSYLYLFCDFFLHRFVLRPTTVKQRVPFDNKSD